MLGYRSTVLDLYRDAIVQAAQLANEFALWSESRETFEIARLVEASHDLRTSADRFVASLPETLRKPPGDLNRHLGWLDYWLAEKKPERSRADVTALLLRDLPDVWKSFEDWIDENTSRNPVFDARIANLLAVGQIDSALRLAWPAFKSFAVGALQIDPHLDGQQLVAAMFGEKGALREQFTGAESEAYANLLRGLYGLNRNLVQHNDVVPDVQQVEAVLGLLSSLVGQIAPVAKSVAPIKVGARRR